MNPTGSKLSHRRRQAWVGVVAALFVGDFVLCGYLPSQQRLMSLREAGTQQRRTIDMAAAQSEELSGLKQRVETMEKIVQSFDARVPADSSLGTFLQQVTGIMTELRLVDQVVLPGKELQTGTVNCIPVHLTCKGSLTDIFELFNRLNALERLVRLEKVVMVNDSNLTGLVSMQTETVIFYQSPKQRQVSRAGGDAKGGSGHGS